MVDSVVTWAREYKVDGFRFDLMGHHSKANMLDVRRALDGLTLRRDGVDGRSIYVYGEGWNFGEVAEQRPLRAGHPAQHGRHRHRHVLRPAARRGARRRPVRRGPARSRASPPGCTPTPTAPPVNGTPAEQRARLLLYHDQIKVGLAGNLRDYRVRRPHRRDGDRRAGRLQRPAGRLRRRPEETITYVDAHDNETLFDALQYKLPPATADGRPGADEHARAGDHGARPEPVVLARRHRPAALEVARPQLLQLRRLVQPDRLVGDTSRRGAPGLPPSDGQRVQVGVHAAAAGRSGARSRRRPTSARPATRAARAAADPLLLAAVPARQRAAACRSACASRPAGRARRRA